MQSPHFRKRIKEKKVKLNLLTCSSEIQFEMMHNALNYFVGIEKKLMWNDEK